jgi:hypothetical protein
MDPGYITWVEMGPREISEALRVLQSPPRWALALLVMAALAVIAGLALCEPSPGDGVALDPLMRR